MADSTLHVDHLFSKVLALSSAEAWSLVAGSVLVYIAYKVCIIGYDLYFGALSKFPGPKLWAASRLPYTKMLWNGEDAVTKHALHEKYGPVIRISPTELSYCDAQAWKDIYGHRTTTAKKSFQKDPNFYRTLIHGEPSIINTNDVDHTRHRRVLAHAFSDKALKEQEQLFKRWGELLITKLGERARLAPSTSLDMVSWYNFTTCVLPQYPNI